MGTQSCGTILSELPVAFNISQNRTLEELKNYLDNQSILTLPDIIIIEADTKGECFNFIEQIKKNALWRELIIVLISTSHNKEWKARALQLKVHDFYILPFPIEHLIERLAFLVKFKLIKPTLSILENADVVYKLPLGKRLFDILVSTLGIILVSPILIITSILIRLDTKGPVLYKSKRVGTGYNIFDFYKFRSMRIDAERQLENLSELNLYKADADEENSGKKSVFVKLIDDPRITRIGNFIRRTSIDELPQLFNVIKGDMSLVGNRPLPLYEAEMLTSNEWSLRFMGPAGVTGLWQIKSRGKRDISERERKKFDNFYALKYSFWFDLEILIKTLPVILHKEKF
ncbi:Sugar transferase involved in LPS biosynthesis (colanic, teichoic acid) [Daejeonella rubra]|uniref:Sugar transferase involved in LPS biosynthesis (Colanic, teichoic acid) n=2 Tax=Daejeonella rubra TaxID=990371 RepID=A0A1G9VTR0_9SPHI|nr:Sugar transferase involved in LPS biosynthesis (colanic, teichoic acid) [Daejeonella rubra]